MGGKLDIYNLGETGVDVVKSPLHEADGDLFKAQNAHADPAGVEGGIRKRDGMAKVNAVALTGAIEGAINVPLPAPGTRTYLFGEAREAGIDPTFPWWSSVGGSSWAGTSQPSQGYQPIAFTIDLSTGRAQMAGCVSYRKRMFYPGHHTGAGISPLVRTWDGTRDMELCRIPYLTAVTAQGDISHMWMHRGVLYLIAGNGVYRVDVVTGAIVLAGDTFVSGSLLLPRFGLSYLDRVWVGGQNSGGLGTIHWMRNGEETWTLERTGGAAFDVGYTHGANYKGDLYVGTYVYTVGSGAIIEKRTAATKTWATSTTGSSTTNVNYWTCFAVFNNLLFAVYVILGAPNVIQVWKYDGSSWALDLNVGGAGHPVSVHPNGVLAETDALYIAFASPVATDADGYILARTTGGVWSKPLSGVTKANGAIGFIP